MRYAMPIFVFGLPCVEIKDGNTPFPEGAVWPCNLVGSGYDMIIDNGNIRWKTEEEKKALRDASYVPPVPEQTEEEYQNSKSDLLKQLENVYIDFLTDQWTKCLHDLGIIPLDDSVTYFNTDELTNIQYLMQVRYINYDRYDQMAGEFDRLKASIISNGGIMSRIAPH